MPLNDVYFKKIITLGAYMRPQIVTILLFTLNFFSGSTAFAQNRGGATPPSPQRMPDPPVELPIDTNILILLTIAIIYGAYVSYKRHKIKNTTH